MQRYLWADMFVIVAWLLVCAVAATSPPAAVHTGDRFEFYDGGGYWGNWEIVILAVGNDEVTYEQTNRVTHQVERCTLTMAELDTCLTRTDGWSWDRVKRPALPGKSVLVTKPKPKRMPLVDIDPALFRRAHKETWEQRLARGRKLQALKLSAEELEIYRRIDAIYQARDELEEEERYHALEGKEPAEIRR